MKIFLSKNKVIQLHNRLKHSSGPRLHYRTDRAKEIDKLIKKSYFWKHHYLLRKIAHVIGEILWIANIAPDSFRAIREFGSFVENISSKSKARQLGEITAFSAQNFSPFYYYYFRAWNETDRKLLSSILFDGSVQQLISYANQNGNTNALNNKFTFHELCNKFDIPTIPIYWLAQKKTSRINLPTEDLFLKPCQGSQSIDIEQWNWLGNGHYKKATKQKKQTILSSAELRKHILDISKNKPFLIQPLISNHLTLNLVSDGSLVVIRLITLKKRANKATPFSALARLPVSGSETDSWVDKSIVSSIDIKTGELSIAYKVDIDRVPFLTHPNTDVRINKLVIPDWQKAINISTKAHNAFGDIACIGWDLAITKTGPILIEGNNGPGLVLHQLIEGHGYAESELADTLITSYKNQHNL